MARFLVPLAAAALLVLTPSSAFAATCADHANRADAQAAADTVDADGDGRYCESLPCPCPSSAPAAAPKPDAAPPRRGRERISARVLGVVDGDTIKVRTAAGARRTVRLIGLDTPETRKPGTPVECGGRQATRSMRGLVLDRDGRGHRVTLTTDRTQDRTDRYDRLLAYVKIVATGRDLAASQIGAGWSPAYVYDEPFEKLATYRERERAAKSAGRGGWGACGGDFHSAG